MSKKRLMRSATISEVADEIDVPQHVLRFWESRFSQIRPMKRGGGRRYYRPDDVDLLRGIRHLLYGEGYTIRGVQRILREQGAAFVQNIWRAGAEPAPPLLEEDAEDAGPGAEVIAPSRACFRFPNGATTTPRRARRIKRQKKRRGASARKIGASWKWLSANCSLAAG